LQIYDGNQIQQVALTWQDQSLHKWWDWLHTFFCGDFIMWKDTNDKQRM